MFVSLRLSLIFLIIVTFCVMPAKSKRLEAGKGWSKPFTIDRRPPTDLNRDRVIDILDLVIVAKQFGQSGNELVGDLNDDGIVNILDLVVIVKQFGRLIVMAPRQNQFENIGVTVEEKVRLRQAFHQLTQSDLNPSIIKQAENLLDDLSWQPKTSSYHQLMLNYPNPFNPETWIPYQLSFPTNVRFSVYDSTGKLVRRLLLGYKTAGFHNSPKDAVYWNGRDQSGQVVASGVYYGVLETGEDFKVSSQYQTIVLLK